MRTYLFRLCGVDLTRINGINPATMLKVIVEVGPDISRFKSAKHFFLVGAWGLLQTACRSS
ncbi:transposase [Nitrosomonas sp.]|uniref:transposase n=1 Tax=Nitrosomonas sp. TaxID=42353 RepID=UPI003417DB08|nr:transposase [Nitrosomonas sp.]